MTGGPGSLEGRIAAVRRRIEAGCGRVDRDPSEVGLIAVSKTRPAADVDAAHAAGQRDFGENRVQEALAKMDETGLGPRWHLIGPLQRNKVRHIVGRFARIHTVADERLADELQKRLAAADDTQRVLIQVNLEKEATKAGLSEGDVEPFLRALRDRPRLTPVGLMTIPPPVDDPEVSRPRFRAVRILRDRLQDVLGLALPELSMGMTDDFEVAVEEGATWVRIGTAIFGPRS